MAVNTTSQSPIKLTLSYKVVWGIAALGLSTISGTFEALQPIFYQDYLGLQARWMGIAAVIYAICNARIQSGQYLLGAIGSSDLWHQSPGWPDPRDRHAVRCLNPRLVSAQR